MPPAEPRAVDPAIHEQLAGLRAEERARQAREEAAIWEALANEQVSAEA